MDKPISADKIQNRSENGQFPVPGIIILPGF